MYKQTLRRAGIKGLRLGLKHVQDFRDFRSFRSFLAIFHVKICKLCETSKYIVVLFVFFWRRGETDAREQIITMKRSFIILLILTSLYGCRSEADSNAETETYGYVFRGTEMRIGRKLQMSDVARAFQ